MKIVATDSALKASGHYSQAVVHNDMVYLSGQLAFNPETGAKEVDCVADEAARVLSNIASILEEAGSSKNKVLKVTVYLSDIQLWDDVDRVYSEFFADHRPARVMVPCHDLHFGFHVEIDAIAYI